jgi:hypothetical protein
MQCSDPTSVELRYKSGLIKGVGHLLVIGLFLHLKIHRAMQGRECIDKSISDTQVSNRSSATITMTFHVYMI